MITTNGNQVKPADVSSSVSSTVASSTEPVAPVSSGAVSNGAGGQSVVTGKSGGGVRKRRSSFGRWCFPAKQEALPPVE